MRVTVNGEAMEVGEGETVVGLLARMGKQGQPAAVEINQSLVRKRDHAGHVLREGDRVEVVTLVGGG